MCPKSVGGVEDPNARSYEEIEGLYDLYSGPEDSTEDDKAEDEEDADEDFHEKGGGAVRARSRDCQTIQDPRENQCPGFFRSSDPSPSGQEQ